MTLSVNEDLAVVHYFRDAETCFVLQGEGLIPQNESRDFQVQDELVTFAGPFISSSARGAHVIDSFARGASADELGAWSEL